MESGPAIFTGVVFALFGGGLLLWTAVRVRRREPVAAGVRQGTSAAVTTVASVAALVIAVWCFARL
ncbi:hypothetical protein AB0O01_20255 [Streptomyces sp. NPDC093252]|uniref:hypothetical protein n=1 Tax=Streptomyces sp. NPDC093252 TaxID=3154980 RepID=UPI003429D1B1